MGEEKGKQGDGLLIVQLSQFILISSGIPMKCCVFTFLCCDGGHLYEIWTFKRQPNIVWFDFIYIYTVSTILLISKLLHFWYQAIVVFVNYSRSNWTFSYSCIFVSSFTCPCIISIKKYS